MVYLKLLFILFVSAFAACGTEETSETAALAMSINSDTSIGCSTFHLKNLLPALVYNAALTAQDY